MRRKKRKSNDYQKLEDRKYLTVSAGVTVTGSLSVRGNPDGPVEITSIGNNQFQITDAGQVVTVAEGVTRNIVVRLDVIPQGVDDVSIDLGNQLIDNVVADLGNGTNIFDITGTNQATRVIYRGGNGDDTVTVNVDTTRITSAVGGNGVNTFTVLSDSLRYRYRGVGGFDNVTLGSALAPGAVQADFAGIVLGNGQNHFQSFATINEFQFVSGGDQADNISSFNAPNTATFSLGTGNNILQLDGSYGELFVRGGNDNQDAVFFAPTAIVNDRVGIILNGGNDFTRVDGTFNTDFFFRGTDGGDQVFFSNTAQVNGDVTAFLGADSNRFTHDGTTSGNLFVTSRTLDDTFIVNGIVEGTIVLAPGSES